jgi:hypothetical protein
MMDIGTGTWKITVAHRDGRKRQYTMLHPRVPREGEIVELKDDAGRTVRARLGSPDRRPQEGRKSLGLWEIKATEV